MTRQPDNEGCCKRCGTCCIHSGPTLHKKDFSLLKDGIIQPEDLVTIRKGEFAYHPQEKRLIELPQEMIKVKGKDSSWMCKFYGDQKIGCLIYENRPIECRVLECWNTEAVERLFLAKLLTRRDIFPAGGAVAELIHSYENAFPIYRIKGLFSDGKKRMEAARLMEQDAFFRQKASKALSMGKDSLDFVFGSPVSAIIERFSRYYLP